MRLAALLAVACLLAPTQLLAAEDAEQSNGEEEEKKGFLEKIPDSGQTGGVTFREGAGRAEGRWLTTVALEEAADAIASDVQAKANTKPVLISINPAELTLAQARLYEARHAIVKGHFQNAQLACLQQVSAGTERQAKMSGVGTAVANLAVNIAAAAKFGSFFQSQYEMGGISYDSDAGLLRIAVAKRLKEKKVDVRLPPPWPSDETVESFNSDLSELRNQDGEAAMCAADLQDRIDRAGKNQDKAKAEQRKLDIVKAARASFEGLLTDLAASPEKSPMPLNAVLQQRQMIADMKGAMILQLRTHALDASYHSETNLWTFLGKMPVNVAGMATVSYELHDSASRKFETGDLVRKQGGFVRAHKVFATGEKTGTTTDTGTQQNRQPDENADGAQ